VRLDVVPFGIGKIRFMMDSRGGRVLDESRRSMVDDEEWAWIEDKATGHFDHLLLGTSLPVLLGPGMHLLQAWNEAVCAGVWGEGAKRLRRSQDLDHWASFHDSFVALTSLIQRVASGERQPPCLDNDPLWRGSSRLPGRGEVPRR
jgi:hypothetical protein